ncbi:MAG: CoA-binding protein [Bacteroidales bacterium]|nr:CoA-binding protein [Bacteroidales bacterium]
MGKIVLIGASMNPARYSNQAVRSLHRNGYEVVAIGRRPGKVGDVEIITGLPPVQEVDKVVLYINAQVQREYYDYIFRLRPGEIIFNPGTENPELAGLAVRNRVEIRYDCALVLLDAGMF